MKIRETKGLTFEDVLLLPRRSSISSRQQVDTSTRLTDRIRINVPVISANMDTVRSSWSSAPRRSWWRTRMSLTWMPRWNRPAS